MTAVRRTALLATALALPAVAHADDDVTEPVETTGRSPGVQIGGFGMAFAASPDHELYDWQTSSHTDLGVVSPGFGLRLAVFPVAFLGLEVEGSVTSASTDDRGRVAVYGFGGHVIVQRPGAVRPFVLGGIGGLGVRTDDTVLGTDLDVVGYGGVGLAVDVTRSVALRGDLRLIRAPAADRDGGTNHLAVMFGISKTFTVGAGERRAIKQQVVDSDGDGLTDANDRCPSERGVEPDGCPVRDTDKDGILDPADTCRTEPETVNAWQDTDGCPDTIPDTDGDGLNDLVDKCVDVREDVDEFEDADGCADVDNDKDGALDAADACPLVVGPLENRGCPDTDRDGDTVVDRLDNCPDAAGTVDNHGCKAKQLVVITPTKLEILDVVYFQLGSAKLAPKSNKLLDNIVAVLQAHPEIAKLRIEGHTDDVGDDAKNLTLSQARAESVLAYLVQKRIDRARLDAKGFGETAPKDPATTPAARAANRRVEFHIDAPAPSPAPAPAP